MNNGYRSSVKDVKVIPGEEIVSPNCLQSMDLVFKKERQEESKVQKKI